MMTVKLIIFAISIFMGIVFLFDMDLSLQQPDLKKKKSHDNGPGRISAARYQDKVRSVLIAANSRLTVKQYFEITILLVLSGISAGFVFHNYLIGIVLAAGLPFFQYQLLLKKQQDMKRDNNEKLEIYMSLVTNAYMQSGDIESAIMVNYSRMDTREAAAKPFETFIAQSTGNANTKQCILAMKNNMDNEYFKQWCDKLALCRDNSKLKYILPYAVNRMRRKRTLDSETVTACHKNYKDFIVVCVMALFMTMVIPMLQPTWRYVIENTVVCKIAAAFVLIVIMLSTAYVVKVSNPGRR